MNRLIQFYELFGFAEAAGRCGWGVVNPGQGTGDVTQPPDPRSVQVADVPTFMVEYGIPDIAIRPCRRTCISNVVAAYAAVDSRIGECDAPPKCPGGPVHGH